MDWSLKSVFKKAVIGGALLVAGALLTEPLIFALVHSNAGGMLTMAGLDPYFQSFFDSTGITESLTSLGEWLGGTEQLVADTGLKPVGNFMTFD